MSLQWWSALGWTLALFWLVMFFVQNWRFSRAVKGLETTVVDAQLVAAKAGYQRDMARIGLVTIERITADNIEMVPRSVQERSERLGEVMVQIHEVASQELVSD